MYSTYMIASPINEFRSSLSLLWFLHIYQAGNVNYRANGVFINTYLLQR
jgi:hypothetical protein